MSFTKNVLLVGCGHIGLKHLDCLLRLQHKFVVNGIFEPNTKIQDSIKQEYKKNRFRFFKTFSEIALNEFDIAIICSPSNLHFNQIKEMNGKLEEIICEKPLFINQKDYKEIKRIALLSKTRVTPVLQVRESSSVEQIKAIIDKSGMPSTINLVMPWKRDLDYFNKNKWRGTKNGDGGIFLNQAIHYFDFLEHIFGTLNNMENISYQVEEKSEMSDLIIGKCMFNETKCHYFLTVSSPINKGVEIEIIFKDINLKLQGNDLENIYIGKEQAELANPSGKINQHLKFYESLINRRKYDRDSVLRHIDLTNFLIERCI